MCIFTLLFTNRQEETFMIWAEVMRRRSGRKQVVVIQKSDKQRQVLPDRSLQRLLGCICTIFSEQVLFQMRTRSPKSRSVGQWLYTASALCFSPLTEVSHPKEPVRLEHIAYVDRWTMTEDKFVYEIRLIKYYGYTNCPTECQQKRIKSPFCYHCNQKVQFLFNKKCCLSLS